MATAPKHPLSNGLAKKVCAHPQVTTSPRECRKEARERFVVFKVESQFLLLLNPTEQMVTGLSLVAILVKRMIKADWDT